MSDSKKTPNLYAPVAQVPVSGTPVSAEMGIETLAGSTPPGLDSFIGGNTGHLTSTETSVDGAPAGLDEFAADQVLQNKHGTAAEQLKAGAEGFAQGLIGPFAPLAEKALGVKEEDILGRREANPVTGTAGEIVGLVGPALLTGGSSTAGKALAGLAKFTQAGALEKVAAKILPEAATTLAGKIGTGAARAAIENMLVAGSDETSKLILNDPNQSADSAISSVGLAGALGGALGGSLGGVKGLYDLTADTKAVKNASKVIEDFRGRVMDHMDNPDPVTSTHGELSDYYKKITDLGDDVYGPNGLKGKEIAASLPELNKPIAEQAQLVHDTVDKSLKKMITKPTSYPPRLASKLQEDLEAYSSALSKDNLTSAEVFDATQGLKQQLQSYSKFDKFVKPTDEAYDFVRDAKKLAFELKNHLEDKAVWGKAAERQQVINQGFRDYLPALKDFEKKFTTEVGGEKVVDPTKVNTYINQLGKPNAQIKQEVLKNFLKASEDYKSIIHDSHVNLGLESPVEDTAMNNTLSTLKETTLGSKLADAFINKGLKGGGGSALAGAVGAGFGEMLGGHMAAGIGAIVGERALAPFFNSVLPAIAKSILTKPTSASGLQAAAKYGTAVARGEAALTNSVKNIFRDTSPKDAAPHDVSKLDKLLKEYQVNPEKLMNTQSTNPHYLPDHGMAVDQTLAGAVTYLNSLRPDRTRKSPLDGKIVANASEKARYNNALQIAQNPTIVTDKIKKGTLTAEDITTLGTLYPNLFRRMQAKITEQMMDAAGKSQHVPYKTRIGLSMFIAQPLDSSMMPASIQAAQIVSPHDQPQNEQQPAQPGKSKGVKSAPGLQKMPTMYKTPAQTSEARRTRD